MMWMHPAEGAACGMIHLSQILGRVGTSLFRVQMCLCVRVCVCPLRVRVCVCGVCVCVCVCIEYLLNKNI